MCLGAQFLGFFWPFFGPFWSFFVKMEEKYHPIAYESGKGMSLGEIPGVAKKKRILGMIFLKNRPRGAFLVTYPTLNSHYS